MTADDRIPLGDSGWSLWKDAVLRSSGFPAEQVFEVVTEPTAAAAHALVISEQALRELNALRRSPRRRLNGRPPNDALEATLAGLRERVQALRAIYESSYAADHQQALQRLRRWIAQARVCEAIIWQNRALWHRTLRAFVRESRSATHGSRRRERLAVRYLQQYCATDTAVDSFGPVAWVSLDPTRDRSELTHSERLVARRRLSCEVWAIDALLDAIQRQVDCVLWSHPRAIPGVFEDVESGTWWSKSERLTLDPLDAAILRRCDGGTLFEEIVRGLDDRLLPADAGGRQARCVERCRVLRDRGLLRLGIELPRSARPLEILRDWLAHVDADARRQIERLFEPLTAAVHRAIVSVDSPDELDRALALVEREFIALTRPSATGQSGQDQARRRLVCARLERDVRAAIGADILAPLSQSLPLLLQTALWFLQELQREYEKAATQLYRTLPTDRGKPWSMLELRGAMCDRGVLSCAPPPWHVAAQRHLEERWATLWMRRGLLSAGQCLRMDAADLEPEIDEMFPIDPGGLLHHASSDVLIARASGTASPTIVIDEIHLIDASDESTVALAPDASLPARGRSVRPVDALVELRDGRLWVRDRTRTFEMPLGELSADLVTLGIRHELSPWPCMSYRPRVVLNNVVIARETWTCRAEELTFAALTTERERYLGARRWARSRRLPRFAFVKVPTESLPLLVDFASTPLVELFMSALRGALARAATADVVVSEMLPCFKELWLEDAAGARYVSRLRVVAVPSVRRRGSRGPVDQEARAVAMDTLAHAR